MDHQLLAWMHDWRHPALTAGMSAITWLGSIVFLLPLAFALGSIVFLLPLAFALGWQRALGRHDWRRWAFLPAAVGGAALVVQALKWLIGRERPDVFPSLISLPADASFPSAHAWQITAFVAAWLISSGSGRRYGQVLAGILLILLIALSRLYLQVHFLSDVLAGILGGLLWVWFLHRLPVWRSA